MLYYSERKKDSKFFEERLRSLLFFCFIGKTASGALLNEKGPRGGGHENGTVVKLEDIKTFCSPIVIEFM